MSVQESGIQPDEMLAQIEQAQSLIDQAAESHARKIVEVARDYGHIRSVQRTIRHVAEGVYEIEDAGTPMVWLAGKRVPISGASETVGGKTRPVIRMATAANIASGKFRYPGREQPMADADNDPRVRAVVEEWEARLMGGKP